MFFHVTIGIWLATLLNRKLPGKSIFYIFLILPWAIPQYIAATTWKGMFNAQYGIIPAIFEKIGVHDTLRFAFNLQDISWIANPYLNFAACILVNIWLGFPFMMMIALGGLQTISSDYYEAAEIDGASGWQKFNYITLPLLMPIMVPAIILGTVWTFNMVNIIYIFADAGRVSEEAHILVTKMYVDGLQYFRYSYASAVGVFIFIILTLFAVLYMKATVKED
ncbi:carbohydrate ABC transporter permease [Thermospira aquatica]|uniref:Sugar ABC transporter permease n=1 Tax=Thermospira aquatica TaxID=2828656 RepID=A0AAX3BCF9_9SPIR|nr:sugar ABC transporter permease [Thermospira aquatica]URA09992.1 sugar ABC transporter permease [Thermospira aquatica]